MLSDTKRPHTWLVNPDLRARCTCAVCDRRGRPLLRVFGSPALGMDWERRERDGRCVYMGCVLEDGAADYQCRHCAAPIFVERLPEVAF